MPLLHSVSDIFTHSFISQLVYGFETTENATLEFKDSYSDWHCAFHCSDSRYDITTL